MAEVKNLFVKSKMNKDLDARLLTNGEYRDAQNISVSKSEGADVGAVENILGNIELIDFETIVTNAVTAKYNALGFTIDTDAINYKNLEVIGEASNLQTDSVVVFLTDWTDTSNDKLSNFPGDAMITNDRGTNNLRYSGPGCFICYYNFQTGVSSILAAGSYLNFSKSHPILGADYLEDFLYFTDNRNQPRKINVSTALARPYTSSSPYYGNEDNISVCKYAPYESIGFIDASNNSTLLSITEKFLPSNVVVDLSGPTGSGGSFFTLNKGLVIDTDVAIGDQISLPSSGKKYTITSLSNPTAVTTSVGIFPETAGVDFVTGDIATISRLNPDYSSSFAGDADLLKEEFPRYSYRYRYDDGEYSLMAPFSQIAFIPKQYGYFLHNDEKNTGESGIVKFMENRVDQIFLQIPMPTLQSQLADLYKISELQILVKNAGDTTVKVIEDILVNNLSYTSTIYSYQYDSTQPFKTLPENEITRVSDKAPIRAASQAIIGNRIVYGNFLDKHTHPISLDFSAKVEKKNSISTSTIRKEYPNHTLKQNRTYQLGLVLMDRYGRSSGVITSDNLAIISGDNKKSSIYAGYTNSGTSGALNWAGNCLGLIMNEPIPSFMSEEGYPGLYGYENPLGWYSYKIVVKQTEQEYYNVYVPGAIAGNITWNKKEEITKTVQNAPSSTFTLNNTTDLEVGMTVIKNNESTGVFILSIASPVVVLSEDISDLYSNNSEIIFQQIIYPSYPNPYATSNIVLFGDNINKVPRDLNKVGPTDRIYSSDIRLFNRVNPIFDASLSTPRFYNTQHTFASPLVGDEAVSIRPFRDLGEWTLQSSRYYPVANQYNVTSTTANAEIGAEKLQLFYKSEDNPFIATLTTNSLIGVNPVLSTSTNNNSDTYTNRNLGVFETEPTTSLLDIFWETSTAGLISDLNTAVDTGSEGPTGFSQINFNLTEGMAKGTQITNFFELVRSDGNPTADASEVNMSNLRVFDGSTPPQDRSNDFQLVSSVTSPQTEFAIITNNEFYYGNNAGTKENYTFTIDCVANDIQNVISFKGQLSNVAPDTYNKITIADRFNNTTTEYNFDSIFGINTPFDYTFPQLLVVENSSNYKREITRFKIKNNTIISSKEKLETQVYFDTTILQGGNFGTSGNYYNVGFNKGIEITYDSSTDEYILTVNLNNAPFNWQSISFDTISSYYIFKIGVYDAMFGGFTGPGSFLYVGSSGFPNNNGNLLEFTLRCQFQINV